MVGKIILGRLKLNTGDAYWTNAPASALPEWAAQHAENQHSSADRIVLLIEAREGFLESDSGSGWLTRYFLVLPVALAASKPSGFLANAVPWIFQISLINLII